MNVAPLTDGHMIAKAIIATVGSFSWRASFPAVATTTGIPPNIGDTLNSLGTLGLLALACYYLYKERQAVIQKLNEREAELREIRNELTEKIEKFASERVDWMTKTQRYEFSRETIAAVQDKLTPPKNK